MSKKKTFLEGLRRFLGWTLIVVGFPPFMGSAFLTLAALFGGLETESFGERIAFFVIFLITAALFFGLIYWGFRLKKTAKPPVSAEQACGGADSVPAAAEESVIQTTEQTGNGKTPAPVRCVGQSIFVSSFDYFSWIKQNPSATMYEQTGVIPLAEKTPVITLVDDGWKARPYHLQTEGDEDFTGKFFQYSVRLGLMGTPPVPTVQLDGFISDAPEERKMKTEDIGYRMEGYFMSAGGEAAKQRYAALRGQDLVAKGLKYPGYTTPSNVRLIGVCPECDRSFAFHGYAFYMMQSDVAYSDDGLDCCVIDGPVEHKETWSYATEGKQFRYYNSFRCPHCGTPYIDYGKYPQNKVFGVSGCVHLDRKHYKASGIQKEAAPVAQEKTGEKAAEEYLDDITFIQDLKHTVSGQWHQYDVLLAARGYGWDFMIRWADYMASADISHISEVVVGNLGGRNENITESFLKNENKLAGLAEISTERSMLSIAGNSQVMHTLMKIVWVNQTNTFRLFTLEKDELLIKKYVETAVRQSFHTKDAMKLGKPIPERK